MPWLTHFLALINALVADRSRLALENVALRQQITVLKRSAKRDKALAESEDSTKWNNAFIERLNLTLRM